MERRRVASLFLVPAAVIGLSAHQTVPAGRGAISGTVIDSAGKPFSGGLVSADRVPVRTGDPAESWNEITTTDTFGAYRFNSLPTGTYLVSVLVWTRTIPIPAAMNVRPGAFEAASVPRAPATMIDADGGHFMRLFGAPGVTSASAHPVMNVTTWAGSTTRQADARPTSVVAGQEQRDVDITVVQRPTVRIDGVLSGSTGPVARAAVHLYLDRSELEVEHPISRTTAFTDGDGRFLFMAVAPGTYIVDVDRPSPPEDDLRLSATGFPAIVSRDYGAGSNLREYLPETTLTIGASDRHDVALTLRHGAQVTGTVVVLKPMQLASGELIPPFYITLGGLSRRVPATGRSQFVIDDVKPGKYSLRAGPLLEGFSIVSATLDGRDVKSAPIEVGWSGIAGLVVTIGDGK